MNTATDHPVEPTGPGGGADTGEPGAGPTGGGRTETGLRFALLMTVVTAAGITMLNNALAPTPDDTPGDSLGCMLASGIDPDGKNLTNILVGAARPEALEECLSGVPEVEYWKGMVATLFLLAVAALVFWWLPRRRERWHRTLPIATVDRDGGLAAELAELRETAGIDPRVRFRVDPARTTAGAVVYGRAGLYTVCLHNGLLVRRGTDPEGFRAVVLHELAHLRNRDVDFAWSSTALWRVFVLLALLPFLFSTGRILVTGLSGRSSSPFWPGAASMLTYSLLNGLLLVALVHLTRADLLRRRELHADAQAVAWGALPAGWDQPEGPRRTSLLRARLRRAGQLLRTHPGWAERRAALADPGRLSTVGAPQMFLTGVAGSLLVNALGVIPRPAGLGGNALLTAALVAPVLWLVLRRSVLRSTRTESGLRAGLWLGCGLLVGELTNGNTSGNEWLTAEPEYVLALPLVGAVPAVWSAQSSRLEAVLRGRWPRGLAALLNGLVTLVLLWGGLGWWRASGRLQAMGLTGEFDGFRTFVTRTNPGPWQDYAWELSASTASLPTLIELNKSVPLAVAAVLMVLFPLCLYARHPGTGLRVRPTLAAGAAGGLLCWAAFAVLSYALHLGRPGTLRERTGAFQYVQLWWLLLTVTAACAMTAAWVAGFSGRHWLLRALLASQVVQLLGYAGIFLAVSADGCLGPMDVYGSNCHWLPANGRIILKLALAQSVTSITLFSACGALAGAGVAWVVRRRHGKPPTTPATPPAVARSWPALMTGGLALAMSLTLLAAVAVVHAEGPASSSASSDGARKFRELLDTPPTARAAKVREWQALAWLTKGGLTRFGRISVAFLALADALRKAGDQKPNANGKIRLDSEEFSRLCADLAKEAGAAQTYFRVPDADLQKKWSNALHRLDRSGRECVSALADDTPTSDKNGDDTFLLSIDDMPAAVKELTLVLEELRARAAPS
ncbi:M48 family metalloprotease [Streptomyces sp. NBC_01317]|uniref:M48 family metalloprotease n=1 Tax=Streptomyces sp. NBC_01317 TaxID=2903822 RepID=UPI002E13B10B|nr:M48 family metalloprotease [Streptomyces sp. NBC_01317]